MYCVRGSAFAKDVLATNEDNFANEWAEAQGLSQSIAYSAQVHFSDKRLFGGHAAWTKSGSVTQSPVSVYSRTESLQMLKQGPLAYKQTVLGGCASAEVCKSTPLDWLDLEWTMPRASSH